MVSISNVETLENSIRVVGEGEAALELSLGHSLGAGVFRYPGAYGQSAQGGGVRIDWMPPEKEEQAVVQLSLVSDYEITRVADGIPLFSAVGESSSYLCAASGDPSADGTGILTLNLAGTPGTPDESENTAVPAGFIAAPFEGDDPLRHWFFASSPPQEMERYSQAYGSWVDAAYAGWSSRYRPNESTWRGGDGGMREFEAVMTAYAAETMQRESDTGLGDFGEAMDAFGGRHSFFSSPYLGNIIGNNEELVEQERERAASVRSLIENAEVSLFAQQDEFLRFLLWHGDGALIEEVDAFAASVDAQTVEDSEALLSLFGFAVEAARRYPGRFPRLTERLDALYRAVRARMVRIGGSTAYPTEDAAMESALALQLAEAYIDYGSLRDDALARDLGISLGLMVLGAADDEGFLPESFGISRDGVVPQQGSLAPEFVYPVLTSNTFYPRLVTLEEELGRNVRLWTVSRGIGAAVGGNSISINFDFAVGETHYAVARGIPQFDGFALYGFEWNQDRRFQTYGVGGWFYEDDLSTLYIKFRHQNRVEQIVMNGL
jgi:hypothetical protein